MIGYKIAQVQLKDQASRRVLVTLEIPVNDINFKSNLHRKDIADVTKAKYRCNKAKVLKIEDSEGKEYSEATTCYSDKKLIYVVGEEVEEKNYDLDIEVVYGEGIHFFLNKEITLLYGLNSIKEGLYESWYDNGQKIEECQYRDSQREGMCQTWYINGQKRLEYNYQDGKLYGLYQSWWKDGLKLEECTYRDDQRDGLCQHWYNNGQKWKECTYLDGKRDGLYQEWNENGEKIKECTYINDREV